MRPWLLFFVLLAPVQASRGQGQEKPAKQEPLTEERALSLALGNRINTAAGVAQVRAAEARLKEKGRIPDPELRLTHEEQWTGETGKEYAIRFNPPNPWVVRAQKAEGGLAINLAHVQLEGMRWTTTLETRRLFHGALHAQATLAHVKNWQAVVEEKKTLYEMLLDRGQVTLPTVLEVRLEFLEASERTKNARRTHENAMNRLLAWTGLPTSPKPALKGETEALVDQFHGLEAETLFLKFAVNHPVLSAMELQAEMAKTRIDQAAGANRLWFNFLQGGFSESSNWWEDEDWRFRVGIRVPLFDRGGVTVEAAKADHEALAAQVELLRQQVRVNLTATLGNLQDAGRNLQETSTITANIAEEVRKTLAEDKNAPEPMLSPETRFKLRQGLHRIDTATLEARQRYQGAILDMEAVLGRRLQVVLTE